MDKKLTAQQARGRIRELYLTINDHPFWRTRDMKYKREVLVLFREVQHVFYSCPEMYTAVYVDEKHIGYYASPAYVIFKSASHDFNASFSEITEENKSDKITEIYSYLSLVRALAEDSDDASWTFRTKKDYTATWRAIENPEYGWHVLNEQPEERRVELLERTRAKVEKINEKYEKTGKISAAGKYLRALLKDIEEGNEYLIKFV